jgi:F420-dependent oxidoreductase-like protein
MRIGLTARGSTVDEIVAHARAAEADGFASVWFASVTAGDPLVAMALVGRATSTIELGTAVLQTYPCHPLLQANRAASLVDAIGRGFTLGIGPSHESYVTGAYGIAYDHPGRNTEEYVRILTGLLRNEVVDFEGDDWTVHSANRMVPVAQPVPVLVSALAPRLLRVAGELADGTILWMTPASAIESHVAPRLHAAASAARRPTPRIVAGLPVAVHNDIAEARAAISGAAAIYDQLPNYRRVLEIGGYSGAAEAAIVGDASSVRKQLQALVDAGATDVWAGIFPVGRNADESLRRTCDVMRELAGT